MTARCIQLTDSPTYSHSATPTTSNAYPTNTSVLKSQLYLQPSSNKPSKRKGARQPSIEHTTSPLTPHHTLHKRENQCVPIDPTTLPMIQMTKETQKGPNRESNAGPRPHSRSVNSWIRKPEGRIIPLNHRGSDRESMTTSILCVFIFAERIARTGINRLATRMEDRS